MNMKFPKYLSSPYQVLWFESDDIALIAMFLTLALIFGNVFWILLFAGPVVYMKFKKHYPRGFLKHLLYFIGFVKFHGYPQFFEKEFLE